MIGSIELDKAEMSPFTGNSPVDTVPSPQGLGFPVMKGAGLKNICSFTFKVPLQSFFPLLSNRSQWPSNYIIMPFLAKMKENVFVF